MTSLYGLMRTYKLKGYILMKNFGLTVFLEPVQNQEQPAQYEQSMYEYEPS